MVVERVPDLYLHKGKTIVKLSLFQVDAFTSKVFSGNPAAVCPLENWLQEKEMLAIAAENNLSETAFFVPEDGAYRLRWFTPKSEVQLCGHATLATAFVIFNVLEPGTTSVRFQTCSGELMVQQDGDYLAMDFPSVPATPCVTPPKALLDGLEPFPGVVLESGDTPAERNYFVVYETENDVRNARPNLAMLERLHPAGVCITAVGEESDFVSRYFAPSYGNGRACVLPGRWHSRRSRNRFHPLHTGPLLGGSPPQERAARPPDLATRGGTGGGPSRVPCHD